MPEKRCLWNCFDLETSLGAVFTYDQASTYIQPPPFLEGVPLELPAPSGDGAAVFEGVRCLLFLGDSVTTDHISPVSRIPPESHSGQYLMENGVEKASVETAVSRAAPCCPLPVAPSPSLRPLPTRLARLANCAWCTLHEI